MAERERIGWGHALTGVAVMIRRASAPLAVGVMVVFLLTAVAPPARTVDPVWALALPAVTLVVARVLAVTLAAVGWLIFPSMHRQVLSELSSSAAGMAGPARPAGQRHQG